MCRALEVMSRLRGVGDRASTTSEVAAFGTEPTAVVGVLADSATALLLWLMVLLYTVITHFVAFVARRLVWAYLASRCWSRP